jgi:hypothetical protein
MVVGGKAVVGDPFPDVAAEVIDAERIGRSADGGGNVGSGNFQAGLVPVGIGEVLPVMHSVSEVLPPFGGVFPLGFRVNGNAIVARKSPYAPREVSRSDSGEFG